MKNNKQNKGEDIMISGLAWYRKSQLDKLLKVQEDSGKLEKTYEEWLKGAEEFINKFNTPRVVLKKVDIDIEELIKWCAMKNVPINSKSRTFYTAQKLKELNQHQFSTSVFIFNIILKKKLR